jgi:excisionase family DNA binding protein
MKKDNSFPNLISIGDAARMLGVTVDTLRRWEKEGKIKSIRLVPNAKRKYQRAQVEQFIAQAK